KEIQKQFPYLKIIVATYFEGLQDNLTLAVSLPVCTLHIDLVRCPEQLDETLDLIPDKLSLSWGAVDEGNIWKNDLQQSLKIINKVIDKIGKERVLIAPSCSLLHSPCDLDNELNEKILTQEIKEWLAFAKQKTEEVVVLKRLLSEDPDAAALA